MKLSIAQKLTSRYMLLAENTQEMIIFFDRAGNILECNTAAIDELGYGNDIYQIPIYEIYKKAFKSDNKQLIINTKHLSKTEESIAYRKNQTCLPVSLKIAVKSEKKIYIGLCTAINISDKKEAFRGLKHMKNELKSFNQIRSEFVANITHELRTPVNGIMGLSDNLLETELTPKQIETVNIIHRCCTNMNTIINDLLDYAKISNNKLIIEQREFSFHDFIHHIIDINKIRIGNKGLKLLVNISNDIPERVIGDELRLTQVLNNLFSNAIKFTSVGQIALEVIKIAQTDQFMELFFMLIDTGIGISLEERDKLFQSFSQVDGSITRRFGGTGLGLSISKKLVEAMNGTIAVDSEKNKGSTFSFSVRLGLPHNSEVESDAIFEELTNKVVSDENRSPIVRIKGDVYSVFNLDHNEMQLSDKFYTKTKSPIEQMAETIKNITSMIENLSICIEMESWEKAEELAYSIKSLIPMNHGELAKSVFRLLLAVRKENREVSLEIINKLKLLINEVK